jgi:hypothetical protein
MFASLRTIRYTHRLNLVPGILCHLISHAGKVSDPPVENGTLQVIDAVYIQQVGDIRKRLSDVVVSH